MCIFCNVLTVYLLLYFSFDSFSTLNLFFDLLLPARFPSTFIFITALSCASVSSRGVSLVNFNERGFFSTENLFYRFENRETASFYKRFHTYDNFQLATYGLRKVVKIQNQNCTISFEKWTYYTCPFFNIYVVLSVLNSRL